MASNVGKDLGLETELADSFAVRSGLFRSSRGGEFDVLDTKGIESLRDSNLGLGIEESVCKLFSLCVDQINNRDLIQYEDQGVTDLGVYSR